MQFDGRELSGKYHDGTPFRHFISDFNGHVLFNQLIPEPATAWLLVMGVAIGVRRMRR